MTPFTEQEISAQGNLIPLLKEFLSKNEALIKATGEDSILGGLTDTLADLEYIHRLAKEESQWEEYKNSRQYESDVRASLRGDEWA